MSVKFSKFISLLLCLFLLFQQTGFAQVAGELNIAGYLSQLHNALPVDTFRPLHLRYLSYNPLENNFKLFIDKGSIKNPQTSEVENTTTQLMQYFFIGLSLPNDSFWVNLRPDSPDNIIDDWLAQTDVGKIMLESDLQLKKDTAKATSPETPEGKRYWDNLYKKTEELFGNENISIPTLTRPWIVPGEIIIRETTDSAYIYKATLKVMLEQDYLKDSATYNFSDPRLKALNEYSSQLIRELIIPKLTKEVNTSKRYASLRQAYYSLILAQWFKARFYGKGGLYSWLIDKKDLTNLTSQDNWSKQDYFKQYQKSFKDGEYNLKEPIQTPFGQSVRSYFSGGMQLGLKPQDFGQFGGQKLSSSPVTTLPAVSSPAALEHVNNKMLGITIAASPVIGEMGEIKFAVSPAAASSPAQKGGLTRRNFLPTLFVGGALARNNFAQRSVPTQPAQLPDLSKLPLEDLLKLLTNDDEALRTAVVTELGKRAVPEAVPPLIRVLDTDPSMAVRAEAARSLHALFWSVILPRQDYLEKATDALLRALSLSGEQAAVVRLAAAEALPTFATRRRVLELISALTQVLLYDLNADVRVAAAKGFNNTTLVGSLESWAELRQHIIPPLLKALSSDRSTEVRMWATASLARTWDNQALEGLIDALDANMENPDVRSLIVRWIEDWIYVNRKSLYDSRAGMKLTQVLGNININEDIYFSADLIRALAIMKYQPAVPVLMKILDSQDKSLRRLACWSLGEIGDARAEEALRSIVDNPGTGIDLFPIEAAISLAKMGSNYGVPLLLQFLSPNVVHDTESYDTCIRAAVELGNLREARALEPLLSLYLNGGPTIGGPTWVSPYADLSILSSIVSIAKNDEISKTAVVQKLNLSGPRLEIWNKFGILIWQDDTNLSDSQIGTIHNGLDALPSKLLKTVNIILWSTNYFLLQTNPSIKTVVITNFYDLPNSSFLSQLFAGIGKVIYSSLTPEEKRTYDQLYWDSIDRPGLAIYPNAYAKDLPFEFRDYMWDSRKYLTWVGYSRQGSTKERFLKKAAFIVRLFAEKGEDGQMYTYIFTVNTDLTITKVRVQLGSDGLPAEATLALMASSQVPMPSLLKKVPEQQSVSADEALHGLGQQPLFIKKMFDELGQRRYGHFGNTAVPASSPAQEPTSAASPKQDTSEASSPAVQSVLYPRERSKMELGFKNSVNIPQLKERVMHYKDMIAQLTITIFPGVVLTEDAKREIIGFIEGLSIPTTIVQLEAGEIGILTRTHFVNILAQTEKLEEFQPLPLPYDTPSINGRIIYSNFLNLAEISQDEQDMLSAEAVLVPTNLNVLNYLTLGALAGRYPHIIDFLISVTKDYAAIDYPKPPILEGLKHLKNMAVIAQETTGWAGAGEQETSRRKLEELNNALDESIALLKKQSGSSPTHASSPAQVQQQMEQPGGIDFRTLPIVTQAIGNLSANLSKLPLERLASVNLDQEWQAIEKMVDSGITPSAERIKEYIQASCVKDALSDIDKVILCISEILRKEEETCCSTDPTLRDILVVFEAGGNIQDLKDVFLGQS